MAYLDPSPGGRVIRLWCYGGFNWVSGVVASAAAAVISLALQFGAFDLTGPESLLAG